MYRLEKTFTFEAAHHLPYHDGKCKRVHGHSWRMTLVCCGPVLQTEGPKQGMLLDYADMKKWGDEIVDKYLDHYDLNETLMSWTDSPTSEFLALWIFYYLVKHLPNLYEVTVEETCTSRCTFRPTELVGEYYHADFTPSV